MVTGVGVGAGFDRNRFRELAAMAGDPRLKKGMAPDRVGCFLREKLLQRGERHARGVS